MKSRRLFLAGGLAAGLALQVDLPLAAEFRLELPQLPRPPVPPPAPPPPPPPPRRLQQRLTALGEGFPGDVGIAVAEVGAGWTAAHGGDVGFPQQSVAKLWTALAVLDAVDAGKLRLDDPVTIRRADLSVYRQPLVFRVGPTGYTTTVRALLVMAVADSDNAANDVLVRLVGADQVHSSMERKGLDWISAGVEERLLQPRIFGLEWLPGWAGNMGFDLARANAPYGSKLQAFEAYLAAPIDAATPRAVVHALAALQRGELLSPASTRHLLDLLHQTRTGQNRLRAGLAPGWTLAHKTGTGPFLGGVFIGTNDIGLMTAPDGRTYAVAVFIARTRRSLAEREFLMRRVANEIVEHWRLA